MKENGLVPEIKRILDKYNYYHVIASMWYDQQLVEMKSLLPQIPRQRLVPVHLFNSPENFAKEVALGVMGFSCNYVTATKKFIRNAHLAQMSVVLWTVSFHSFFSFFFIKDQYDERY